LFVWDSVFGANTFALSGIDPTFDTSILSMMLKQKIVAVQPDGKILVLGKIRQRQRR
jgi:hypothetical protein